MVGKEWKILSSIKDKASLIKETVSTKSPLSKINKAVIRATLRTSNNSPPPEYRIATVLNFCHESRAAARASVEAIIDRLRTTGTTNPYVALKCLVLIHHVINRSPFLSGNEFTGGGGFLLLPPTQKRKVENNLELSQWVRWYAAVLEHYLITSRVLRSSSAPDLLRELESLVSMVEGICAAPDSLHYQRMDLVYELMLMVSEDYRSTQRQIRLRLEEFGDDSDRIGRLSRVDSAELISCLERLEQCLPRLIRMFGNRKRNDEFWELISQVKIKIEIMNERREKQKLLYWNGRGNELTRENGRVVGTSRGLSVC